MSGMPTMTTEQKATLIKAHGNAFCDAILSEDVDAINELLDKGLQLIVDDIVLQRGGHTPLTWACTQNKPKSVEALIARGANVHSKGFQAATPMHFSASWCPAVLPLLIANGGNIHAACDDGTRPLHWAFNADAARVLVAAGADLNSRDDKGETPLLRACLMDETSNVQFLLEQPGTDITARDNLGQTAIHHSAEIGATAIIQMLLTHPGVDTTAVDNDGDTALHHSARGYYGTPAVMKLLLPHFHDVNVKNNAGRTPLAVRQLESRSGSMQVNQDITVVLLEAGAEVESTFEEELLKTFRPFLVELYRNPTAPLPAYRRTLRWTMTSPVVAAALPCICAEAHSASADASPATLPADIDDTKALCLGLFRADAWERRKHLVIDRTMTIREAEMEQARSRAANECGK